MNSYKREMLMLEVFRQLDEKAQLAIIGVAAGFLDDDEFGRITRIVDSVKRRREIYVA